MYIPLFKLQNQLNGYIMERSLKQWFEEVIYYFTNTRTTYKVLIPPLVKKSLAFLSVIFLLTSIISAIIIHHYNYLALSNIFDKGGFENFYNTYKLSLSLLYALVASTTLLFTYRRINQTDEQLNLMNMQREASYRPDLFFADRFFKIVVSYLENDNTIVELASADGSNYDANIYLYNVGQASAINVACHFEFDYVTAIEMINKVNSYIHLSCNKGEDMIQVLYGKKQSWIKLEDDYHLKKINFLLPESRNTVPAKIKLPKSYFTLLSLYRTALLNQDLYLNELKSFPTLYLDMGYSDIGDKYHGKVFALSIETKNNEDVEFPVLLKFIDISKVAQPNTFILNEMKEMVN